jgi:serine/threonine-protein kinase
LLGQTPPSQAVWLEEHLAGCTQCLQTAARMQPSDALVESVHRTIDRGLIGALDVDNDLIARLCRLNRRGAIDVPTVEQLLSPPQAPDEIGRIGPYGIMRMLGRGGMGIVFAARQDQPRRMVAVKMLDSGALPSTERLERFRAESETLARLNHPQVVRVLAVGEHLGRPYFTTELAEGGSLAQKLAQATLPAREAAELVHALAETVAAAHAQGIIHRDLKPSNVLLTRDGTPLIADFGLAKQFDCLDTSVNARTATGAILGTPSYMAPEQASGRNEDVGPATDVYAVGAILYECLTGRPPFKAATVLETLEQVRTQGPLPPGRLQPNLPRDLQTICLKCLEKEPHRRYESASALADDLERFVQGKPIVARPVRPWERAAKWARREPSAAALLGVCVLSAVALTVGALVHDRRMSAALDQAQANEAEAERQRQRAQEYYRQARDALDRMLKEVDRYQVGDVPQLKQLQRRQLEEALAFYLAALKQQDDPNPEVHYDAAFACRRAADIQLMLGNAIEAEANYERAIALVEGLPTEQHERLRSQYLLANCYNHRGLLANRDRRWDAAEQHHMTSREILERLTRAEPANTLFRSHYAETEHYLGAVYQLTARPEKAEAHYQQAQKLYAALIKEHPESDGYTLGQANNQINLALLWQGTPQRFAEVTGLYETTEGLLQALRKRRPLAGDASLSLAGLYGNWGNFLRERGKHQAALDRLNRAVDLSEAVLKQEPGHTEAKLRVCTMHGARAQVHEVLGHWSDALADWDRVVELNALPNGWTYRVLRAAAMARAGAHDRAAAEAETLAADPQKLSSDDVYNVACVWALSASAVEKDGDLEINERGARANHHTAQAISLLRRLRDRDYFKDPTHVKLLATDDDLVSLRNRTAFMELLREVRADKR